MAATAAQLTTEDAGEDMFVRIGVFLAEHRLSPEPSHYAFAYHVLSEPEGPVARSVAAVTDGGFRLSGQDIENFGGEAVAGAPVTPLSVVESKERRQSPPVAPGPDALMARTQVQVEGFADTVRTIHAETRHFGRDLAASAAAFHADSIGAGIEEIAGLARAMIGRVERAEERLATATREANELRRALDEARGSARTDPLTDLPNRRAFDEAFDTLPAGAAATVAICDIDHFKQINDNFGHAVGDRILRAIGQLLASECTGHMVARYGGEEFALLLHCDPDEAVETLERARAALAAKRFRARETSELIGKVTLSAGVAEVVTGETRDAVLCRADAAMYRAKQAGRNRVDAAPRIGE